MAPKSRAAGGGGGAAQPAWEKVSRYGRRAEVVAVERLTVTGTVRIIFEVVDEEAFEFSPGYWIGVEEDLGGIGLRHSPYCIFSPPTADRRFEILIRVFAGGPLGQYLASLRRGDRVRFRGPSGRSMLPKEPGTDLVLLATGVGISPFFSLCSHLLAQRDGRRIRLFWGLRLVDDICLVDELDRLAARHRNFSYRISLSQPPADWSDLRGRVTESVPPLLVRLGETRFLLSGNGAMVEEAEVALSCLGVDRTAIHGERFFNVRHKPDPATIEAIVDRFVAHDIQPALTNLRDLDRIFPLERDAGRRVQPPPP